MSSFRPDDRDLGSGPFEACPRRMGDVKGWLSAASQHVESARLLAATDGPIDIEMVIDACHTAVRKAIWAHMNFNGCRIASGVGNHHQVTIDYGRASITEVPPDLWTRIGALRKARNEGDYTNPTDYRLTPRDASDAIEIATGTVALIKKAIRAADQAEQAGRHPRP